MSGASTYDLWIGDITTNQSPILRNSQVGGTVISVSVTAGHYYRWWVRALNASGDYSSWSGGTAFNVALATPTRERADRLIAKCDADL